MKYEINVLEIGSDEDHVHFLIQSVPSLSPAQIARIIMSITAREIYRLCPEVKKNYGADIYGAQAISFQQ